MATYTLSYVGVARNLSQTALALLMSQASAPRDPSPVSLWGLTFVSDDTNPTAGSTVTRVIVYTGPAGKAPYLEDLNRLIINKAAATLVQSHPVVVT